MSWKHLLRAFGRLDAERSESMKLTIVYRDRPPTCILEFTADEDIVKVAAAIQEILSAAKQLWERDRLPAATPLPDAQP